MFLYEWCNKPSLGSSSVSDFPLSRLSCLGHSIIKVVRSSKIKILAHLSAKVFFNFIAPFGVWSQ